MLFNSGIYAISIANFLAFLVSTYTLKGLAFLQVQKYLLETPALLGLIIHSEQDKQGLSFS